MEATRTLEPAPQTARVRFVDAAADYQTGSVVVRGSTAGGGETAVDLPMACGAGLARNVARRLLMGGAAPEGLSAAVGPLEAMRLEAGDAVTVGGRAGVWRITRAEMDETPRLTLAPVVDVAFEAEAPDWRAAPPTPAATAPFVRVLDLPPLPGGEGDARPLAAVALEPWRPMTVHGGGSVGALRERGRAVTPATVGRLTADLAPGVLHRWDEVSVLRVVWEGRAPESVGAEAVLGGANPVAVETAVGWEIVQFREAVAEEGGVWALRGLLRGQQGTEAAARAGAATGAIAVRIDAALARLEVLQGERGLPMLWRAGPVGAPPGGELFGEDAVVWRGVHDRPWAPTRLRADPAPEGQRLSWIARARLDGDRWDGEAAASDPLRFRLRVLEGALTVRSWEVEGMSALYPAAQAVADLAAGADRISVSQWSPAFGWGAETTITL